MPPGPGSAAHQQRCCATLTGIAAPIFKAGGAIFAVSDVGCVTTRLPAKRRQIGRELVAAATTLSHLLTTKADHYESEHQHQ
jgi:DNA-binding IclR family transcriptional regulator